MKPDDGGAYASATFPLGILDYQPKSGTATTRARRHWGNRSPEPPAGDEVVHGPTPIFVPKTVAVAQSQMTDFVCFCEETTGFAFDDAAAFHQFSVEDYRLFWRLFLEWSGLEVEGSYEPVCAGNVCETAVFFPKLRLSFVQNLLAAHTEEELAQPALTACNERGERISWSRGELTERVLRLASALHRRGLRSGDRVVAVVSNTAEAAVACLATAALGAVWSSIAPDLGLPSMVERFNQLSPTWLFFHGSYVHHGYERVVLDKIGELVRELPTLENVVRLRGKENPPIPAGRDVAALSLRALFDEGGREQAFTTLDELPRFPFNHPLYILFSSGTTGRPKCIVHGAGGTLVEHVKEHRLHTDLRPGDTLYFHTTCGWMMYNWQLSALASGAHIVVYDGSVSYPEADSIWQLVERERVTVFGTSPGYLQYTRDAGIVPRGAYDLRALRAILSTGSVLPDSFFRWAHDAIKAVPLQSISGGTDIIGCFLLGHPHLPVYEGELQSKSLGLDVRAIGMRAAAGKAEDCTTFGELICQNPFPSRPLGLFGDGDGTRFHDAYFRQNPGVWTHGDLLELTARGTGRIHGRSDGVMNIRGIRIGPAEIYHVLASIPEVADAVAVEQAAPSEPGGSRLVLVVVLREGHRLDSSLVRHIRKQLSEQCSTAHAPSVIAEVDELPTTHSGKRSDRAVRDAINGRPVINVSALRNPECLRALHDHPAVHLETAAEAASPLLTPSEIVVSRYVFGEPAEALQARLSDIWATVLGAPVGPDDNFFEMGGHSLMAVTLLARVEKEFGRRLPMSSLLEAGTVRGMVALLQRGASHRSSLIAIQPKGRLRPVYWLPGGGGLSVLAFREVSLLLGPDRPVYGLEAELRLDGSKDDLPSMARDYIEAIRQKQPHGPYILFGFSLGSWMAYEIANQLHRQGEKVALLGIFDTAVPGTLSSLQQVTAVAQRARHHFRNLCGLPVGGIVSYLNDTADVVAHKVQRKLARPTEPVAETAEPSSIFDEVDRKNRAIIDTYSRGPHAPYPGRVTLFLAERTSQSGLSPELDARLGWRNLARGGTDVHKVPGSHLSMLEQPHVQGLARILRECLARADQS
ncbi:acetoacetate--CoA ligase [Pendulispora albinea]|uniref:Acetoacetate--CoA ligase n=1 Tax=Pendulispora albinea TaxID=2741071 RepID=A0ABZ2LW44_9BACT